MWTQEHGGYRGILSVAVRTGWWVDAHESFVCGSSVSDKQDLVYVIIAT